MAVHYSNLRQLPTSVLLIIFLTYLGTVDYYLISLFHIQNILRIQMAIFAIIDTIPGIFVFIDSQTSVP